MTINCAERGLLLLRVRDEIRMTIAAYQVTPQPPMPCLMLELCLRWHTTCFLRLQ